MRILRSAVKQLLPWCLDRSGVPLLLHHTLLRQGLTIATYHGLLRAPLPVADWCFLSVEAFRAQVAYLQEHFEVLPLEEAAERVLAGHIDRPTAVITFDDGFQSVHDLAFPVLREFRLPAMVFLNTGLCGTANTVWFCRLHRALCRTTLRALTWRGERYDLRGPAQRAVASEALQLRLKALPHREVLVETRRVVLALGDDPDEPLAPSSPYRMLSHEAVREMAVSGLVEFGGHTRHHAILSGLSDEERWEEVAGSVADVSALVGRPCRSFAYPNGCRRDYDPASLALLRSLGVRLAVTSIAGPNFRSTPPLELRRYGIGAGTSMARFRCMVHHMMGMP